MEKKIKYLIPTTIIPDIGIEGSFIFLNPHVVDESVISKIPVSDYEIIPEIWKDEVDLENGNIYLESVYGKFIERIGGTLNKIHGVNYPNTFWEIPLSVWLLTYLHTLWDRYLRLKKAKEIYGKENLILLSCDSNFTPSKSYSDFVRKYSIKEQTVSYLFGEVSKLMGIEVLNPKISEFDLKPVADKSKKRIVNFRKNTRKTGRNFKRGLIILFQYLSHRNKGKILIDSHVLNRSIISQLFLIHKLKASFYFGSEEKKVYCRKVDRYLLQTIKGDNDFEHICIKLLPKLMPKYLLEEFNAYKTAAGQWSGYKCFLTSNGWVNDYLFSYIVSLGQLNGSKIVVSQHGGAYGQHKRYFFEFIERRFCDYYITWGWSDNLYKKAKIVPLPQPKFTNLFNKHKKKLPVAVFVTNTVPKYVYRLLLPPVTPVMMPKYLKIRKRFFSYLNNDVRKFLICRHYMVDNGWLEKEIEICNDFPEIKIDNKGSLSQLLKKIKLCICDNIFTAFLEALAINTPTILLWDYKQCKEREEATKEFDILRKAGILYHDPIKAADHVNEIWTDVQSWWEHSNIQDARLTFIEKFCRVNNKWQKQWIEVLNRII